MLNILYIITVVVVNSRTSAERNTEDTEVTPIPIERNSKDTGVDSHIFNWAS